MVSDFRGMSRGLVSLIRSNLKHYSGALFGIRLRLDPDYPMEGRFRGDLIVDAVLEYRFYGLFAPWSVLLAVLLPSPVAIVLAALWEVLAWRRADFYSSAFRFWRRAYQESPTKMRTRIRYEEELIREIERRMKSNDPDAGAELDELMQTAMKIQNGIIERKP